MGKQTFRTSIQFRRDTAEQWLLNKSFIPLEGEPCYDLDNHILKIGDGVHTYEELAPIQAGDIKALLTRVDNVESTVEEHTTAIELIELTMSDFVRKEEVYTKTEIGEIAEGKTLVEMINEMESKPYDDTEIRNLISGEATRAQKAESDLAIRLTAVETFFEAVETPDEVINTLAEIVNYIESDKSGAAAMAASIKENTDAIAAINDSEVGILALAKNYTDEKIGQIPMATAEKMGLVKFDDKTIKRNENDQLYIAEVSTDNLVQGQNTLILDGGSAAEA